MVPVLANNTLTITSPRACESSKTGCILVMHPVFIYYKDYKTSSNIYVELLHLDTYSSIITFMIINIQNICIKHKNSSLIKI